MKLLTVDTCRKRGSLGLLSADAKGVRVLGEVSWEKDLSHSEEITLRAQDLLIKAKMSLDELGGVLVASGPGSFTGVRVSVNFGKSLAYGLGIPCGSINTALLSASHAPPGSHALVILQGFRDLVYLAHFDSEIADIKPLISLPLALLDNELAKGVDVVIWAGDGMSLPEDFRKKIQSLELPLQAAQESPQTFVRLLERRPELMPQNTWKDVKPLYIRASEAEEKLRGSLPK